MSQEELLKTDCWCYAMQRQVNLKGKIIGKRQADLLEIHDCQCVKCPKRGDVECLVGKIREGRW